LASSGRLRLLRAAAGVDAAGAVFESMLAGWRDQQLARNLNLATIEARERVVRRFRSHGDVWPWEWLPGHLSAWVADLRTVDHHAHSTVRSYELAVGSFCEYACDPAYGWDEVCLASFGSAPSQICRADNVAAHTTAYEGRPHRRSLTHIELQALFDAADDHVEDVRSKGRKGWVGAFRDATMLKVAYAWGCGAGSCACSRWPISVPTRRRTSSADTGCVMCAGGRRPREARPGGAAC
jgi:hypothetical protein